MADEFAQYIVKTSPNNLGADEFDQYRVNPPPTTPPPPQQQGFFSNVGADLSKRWKNIGGQPLSRPEGVYRDVGQVAGGIQDVVGEGLKSAYKTVVPQKAQEAVSKGTQAVLNTSLGKLGISALQKGVAYWNLFKKSYPEIAKDIEATVNIASLLPIGKGVKVVDEATGAGEAIGVATKKTGTAIKEAVYPTPSKDEALGQIIQGGTKDIAKGEKALAAVNTEGVKTYAELDKKLNAAVPDLMKKVDTELAKDTKKYRIDQLSTQMKTEAGTIVQKNYVTDALTHLKQIYAKTGNVLKEKQIEELWQKANTEGLTKQEVNNLARQYGNEYETFNPRSGQRLTSTTSEMYETTRKGLKDVAREGLGPETKETDATLSSVLNTKRLVQKNVEAVNKLRQRIDQRGLGEKIGRGILTTIDVATAGIFKGAVLKILPRGMGYKIKNALDLEESLQRNLKIVNKALAAKSDGEMISIIKSGFKPQ